MSPVAFTEVLTDQQIGTVEDLAREIWTEHYTALIGREQVAYMLDRFQSGKAIASQIADGVLYYLIEAGGQAIGYLAVQPKERDLFLSKIYVSSSCRGRGIGRRAVHFAEDLARARGLARITLTVNRGNAGSIRAYEKFGFRNAGAVVQDIGNGFVMDDFIMEKII
jgi:ribosomal protein S18 acetylase RimI-like enzyme